MMMQPPVLTHVPAMAAMVGMGRRCTASTDWKARRM